MYKQPMYKVEVKAYLCSIEIFVNEIPSFSYFGEPQIATDIPINNLIFKSGKQKLRFKITPLFNNEKLNKETKIEINIFVKEANDFYLKKEIVASYRMEETVENKPFFEGTIDFLATIPYTLELNRVNYSFYNEDEDLLFTEIYSQYKVLSKYINIHDLKNYNEFTKIRFNDFATSHYLTDVKKQYYLDKALFTHKNYNLSLILKEDYKLNFCYDKKLVYLKKPKNALGLILEDKTSNEEGLHFIEGAIFFRNEKRELELFR